MADKGAGDSADGRTFEPTVVVVTSDERAGDRAEDGAGGGGWLEHLGPGWAHANQGEGKGGEDGFHIAP
jgi:hypothetical protein